MPATSEDIKRSLIHKIIIGQYPIGSTLPSCRDLAAELGINRNTASKIYQEMARAGLVKAIRGRGVVVINRQGSTEASVPGVRDHLLAAAREAKLLGLGREAFLETATQVADNLFHPQRPAIAFIECNWQDARHLAHEIEAELHFSVEPLLLDTLQQNPESVVREYDVICTTLYHLLSVKHALGGADGKVIAVHAPPDPDALLEIARLAPETRVGIVCVQETTRQYLATAVAMLHRAETHTCLMTDREALDRLRSQIDVVIDVPSCHREVARLFPDLPVVTVGFRIDSNSLTPLRERLALLLSTEDKDTPSAAVDTMTEE